jgi:RNA polymerase sigma-70 factor (ECF subfamily)
MAIRADDVDFQRDRALVERYQAGDDAAFDELYRRYYERLARFCQKRVFDHAEAEDVAQEAFARALAAMPGFGGDKRFYPWVSVIAARLCVDTHRRLSRTEPVADPDAGSCLPDLERLERAVDRAVLEDALGRIDARHRDVLRLREQDGWAYQRIAEHYGVTLGTVEALLFRARRALRREYLAAAGADRPVAVRNSPARRVTERVLGGIAAFAPLRAVLSRVRARARSAGATRRLIAARDRLAALGGQLAPVAGTVSFAVATTAAGLAAGSGPGLVAGAVATPVAAAWSAPSTAAPAAPASPGALAPVGPAPPPGAGTPSSAAPVFGAWREAAARPLLQWRGASVTRDGSAARQAAAMPVHASTGPIAVGSDPAAIVSSNVQALNAWLNALGRLP